MAAFDMSDSSAFVHHVEWNATSGYEDSIATSDPYYTCFWKLNGSEIKVVHFLPKGMIGN